jgi:two-component system, NtrC family, nitrogen regulation sensor histidine kinase NtrY
MATPSRTATRLSLAVLLAAVIPLFGAIYIARSLVGQVSSLTSNSEVGQRLERSLDLYQELARAIKEGMRYEADAIAAREGLRAAALLRHEESVQQELAEVFPHYPNLVALGVADANGNMIGKRDRGRPIDDKTERRLEVQRPLSDNDTGPVLVAEFATPRARFDELESAAEFVRMYRQIEGSRAVFERQYLQAFAGLVGVTMLAAAALGTLLARSVTRRIGQLATATQAVGAGDLRVRVPVSGNDEITDLARAFNRMLHEVERTRARIEFLQRMGTWQEMARRLAHEIKNPLTPIQLAVQECHRKYNGEDARFRTLLDTTLEIVEEEVGTLRRLVSEFSSFARLPRAELSETDLADFLRDQREHLSLFVEEDLPARSSDDDALVNTVEVSWEIPDHPLRAWADTQMLHRVVVNLIRNAAQAIRDAKASEAAPTEPSSADQENAAGDRRGHVKLCLREIDRDWMVLEVDDDGPGIPPEIGDSIFDPYVTTKKDGTGLGLAIVKKVVMEHGGFIECGASALGGARISIRIPRSGSAASLAAREPGQGSFWGGTTFSGSRHLKTLPPP